MSLIGLERGFRKSRLIDRLIHAFYPSMEPWLVICIISGISSFIFCWMLGGKKNRRNASESLEIVEENGRKNCRDMSDREVIEAFDDRERHQELIKANSSEAENSIAEISYSENICKSGNDVWMDEALLDTSRFERDDQNKSGGYPSVRYIGKRERAHGPSVPPSLL